MESFNVIVFDINAKEFKTYDVLPYLVREYKAKKKNDRPHTFDEFKAFVKKESTYQFWGRCEYEIILSDWPPSDKGECDRKVDVHWQIMNNIDIVTELLMMEVADKETKTVFNTLKKRLFK